MVGGDDDDVVELKEAFEFREPSIEGFEGGSVAGNVAPVAIKHVEIDEIREDEIAAAGWTVRDTPDGFTLAPQPPYEVLQAVSDLVVGDNASIETLLRQALRSMPR